jgi:hypothetical protein
MPLLVIISFQWVQSVQVPTVTIHGAQTISSTICLIENILFITYLRDIILLTKNMVTSISTSILQIKNPVPILFLGRSKGVAEKSTHGSSSI